MRNKFARNLRGMYHGSMKSKITTAQLAKLTGKTKRTIQNWAKGGKISYEKDESGFFIFDLSEAARVFPDIDFTALPPNEIAAKEREIFAQEGAKIRAKSETELEARFLSEKIQDLETRLEKTEQKLDAEQASTKEEREKYLAIIKAKDQQLTNLLPAPHNTTTTKAIWASVGLGGLFLIVLVVTLIVLANAATGDVLDYFSP